MKTMMDALKGIWRSIFRYGWPRSAKEASVSMTENFFLHLHPVKVRRETLMFRTTLGLGFLSAFLFLVLTMSGLLLMFYFSPHPGAAYRSMKDLEFAVSFGWLLRNIHRWSAHAMVAVVFLHMCRVFYTAAYKPPREFNWVIGVALLVLTFALSFTGYLLPWDQLAFWAITVGTSVAAYAPLVGESFRYLLLGGHTIGEAALLRFYVLHCVVLPLLVILLLAIHFWRVRKDGGLAAPPQEPGREQGVVAAGETFPAGSKTYGLMALVRGSTRYVSPDPDGEVAAWPGLVYRELLLALLATVVLVAVSIIFDAPLEDLADPTRTPNPAKAPWYFLGLQEMVHYSALVGGVVVPALLLAALLALPYMDRAPHGTGVWFHASRRRAIWLFTVVVAVCLALTLVGNLFRGPNWAWVWPWQG
jgi:quinol-cytochrome oxidoreductase complex cytochrome b subunit